MSISLFDPTTLKSDTESFDFISNILQSSTEYSIIGKDLDGNIILWNEGAHRMYGYTAEEMVGKANSSILHTPEDIEAGKPREIMEAALRDGKWEGTVGRVRKSGARFTARMVITPRKDATGRAVGFLLISKDISDEIRLTEELQASQFYTRSLIESNIDALMTTDPLGIITDVNQQMETLMGRTRDELIGSPFKNYFTDSLRAEDGIRSVLREGRVTNYELTARAKEGLETVVSYNATTFNDQEGNLQGVFAAARDVTDRKLFEQTLQEKNVELETANLAKDRFLASMSHELRTPLNAIIGFTGTLLMKLSGPLTQKQEDQLHTVQGSSRHLLALINDLLDLAKIESGKIEINLEPIVAQSVVEEVAQSLRHLAETKGLEFKVSGMAKPLEVQADRRVLSQIVINMANNAIKFTDKGSVKILMGTRNVEGHSMVEISVTDTGVGIKAEDQEKLFQAFEQVEGTHRTEGTGLGLYLSQKLASLLGGYIELRSEFAKGSTFSLLIPASGNGNGNGARA